MKNKDGAIVPQQPQSIQPRPLNVRSRSPGPIAHQQSHYVPVPMHHVKPISGLNEVVAAFLYGGVMIIGFSLLSLAVIHVANTVYWQSERMHQRIQPGYLGGPWNEDKY